MKQKYRVQKNEQFQEVRRNGRSFSNKLLVLCVLDNQLSHSRFGFSISKRIGNAVVRNLVKRRLRESMRLRVDQVELGWDVVFIARHPIRFADYHEIDKACARLLRRANLFNVTCSITRSAEVPQGSDGQQISDDKT